MHMNYYLQIGSTVSSGEWKMQFELVTRWSCWEYENLPRASLTIHNWEFGQVMLVHVPHKPDLPFACVLFVYE